MRFPVLGCLVVALGICLAVDGAVYYVDDDGDNGNSGTSPDAPWLTITYALSQISTDTSHTIAVFPGEYGTWIGESYPLSLPDGLSITGSGPNETIVIGEGASTTAILAVPGTGSPPITISSLALENALTGLVATDGTVILENCLISTQTEAAIDSVFSDVTVTACTLTNAGDTGVSCEGSFLTVVGGKIVDNPGGNGIDSVGSYLNVSLCEISGHGFEGVSCQASTSGVLSYCHIHDNDVGVDCTDSPLFLNECDLVLNLGDGLASWDSDCLVLGGSMVGNGGNGSYLVGSSDPRVEGSTVQLNDLAGIEVAEGCRADIVSCTLRDNLEGVLVAGSEATAVNCVIMDNVFSGAVVQSTSTASLINCTVFGHSLEGAYCEESSWASVTNSILWQNGVDLDGCEAAYCNSEDGANGEGNFSEFPEFVDQPARDFHLKGSSPCIDRGISYRAPETDRDGVARPQLYGIDVGAYEYESVCTPGDLDGDGDKDLFDVLRLVDMVLDRPPPPSPIEECAGDVDGDGDFTIFDILMVVDLILGV